MTIPTPYLFQLETPLLLFGNRLYQAGNLTERDSNFIRIGQTNYGLEEISSPASLEELFFSHHASFFHSLKESYVEQTLRTEFLSREAVEQQLEQNKILSLIVNNVLPVITSVQLNAQIDQAIDSGERSDPSQQTEENLSARNLRDLVGVGTGTARLNRAQQRDVEQQAERIRQELMQQINSDYARYSGAETSSQNIDLDALISQAMGGRLPSSDRLLTQIGRRTNGLNSILTTELVPGMNFLMVEDGLYELLTVKEYLGEFRDKMAPDFFSRVQRLREDQTPEEVNEFIGNNIGHIEHKVRSKIKNKLRSLMLNFGGTFFIPLYVEDNSQVKENYQKLLEKHVKLDAIRDSGFQSRQLAQVAEEKRNLEQIANLRNYEKNGAGFELVNGVYYVYITTPSYVLRSPHNGNYYKFPPGKVGVTITLDGRYRRSDQFKVSNPIIMNSYEHPFLSGSGSQQTLCMGAYNTDRARRLSPEQCVLTLLTKAQETLMMGYRTGNNPYRRLGDSQFGHKKVSDSTVRRQKLICLNDFRR
ncbi:hypothetical protein HN587_00710 [Candidatus Woesearchaeota archaeon]|jgi:hypothetical protein|nr:hypothetical protein [Candidatus Woesearchaeota archaeon]